MITRSDVILPDGRTLQVYDTDGDAGALAVCWHHGTPNIGAPPSPLFDAARQLGLRWFSFDRPGYGRSSPHPDRTVATVAADAAAAADSLGIDRFATVGHSGGGPHALACAAVLGERVVATVAASGLAPFDADGLDWFAGMAEAGVGSNRAAAEGRASREAWETTVVDDDLAIVADWGFAPADIRTPVLVVHGDEDRVVPVTHARWLAEHIRGAELWTSPGGGHITALDLLPDALTWLADRY